MTSYYQRECVRCGQPCDGFYCYLCTCPQCGVNLLLENSLNCTYGDGKPITCCGCEGPLRGGFCSFCSSRNDNSFAYNPKLNYFNNDQKFSDYPPQPRYETNFCELCGNDAHFGYDCPTQVPFNSNPDPRYNQNFDNNFPQTSPSSPQQIPCDNCEVFHENDQCQPMNQNYDPNFCYNPIYPGFDQYQPTQFSVIHPPQVTDTELLQARENLMETIQAFLKEYDHIPPEEKCMALLLAEERFLKIKQAMEEEQNQPEVMQELLLKLMNDLQILKGIQSKQADQEEPAAQNFLINLNFPMADEDEHTFIYRKPKAITPDLPIEEPDNSLSMGDEHLNTIPETEKSSVENLVPIPSQFKGISDDICDVPD
ncbi:hypothetical protein Tco_1268562 [Tanacetum coccineum]